jgi:hypothetical protein
MGEAIEHSEGGISSVARDDGCTAPHRVVE